MKKRLLALLLAALTALSLTACGAEEQPVTSQIFAMDTVMDFAVYGENAQAALTAASQEINALEQRLSRTRAGSEISTLNETGSAELSDETVQLLQSALALSDETGGAFDITIAPLVTAWGITSDTPRRLPRFCRSSGRSTSASTETASRSTRAAPWISAASPRAMRPTAWRRSSASRA